MKKFIRCALAGLFAFFVMFGLVGCDVLDRFFDGFVQDKPAEETPGDDPSEKDSDKNDSDEKDPEEEAPNEKDPNEKDPNEDEKETVETVIKQKLNYTDSVENFYSPDQGFYHPVNVTVTRSGAAYNKAIIGESNLFHLRMDISAFSAKNAGGKDEELTPAALDGIRELLKFLHDKNKNAIVRFCYAPGFGDTADREPSLADMVGHAKQFLAVINDFPTTVTAVEVGMVGPWGEMHSSAILQDPAVINTLIDTFLENTESSQLPVSVRTPRMIRAYLNLAEHRDAYRLGLFNDGYLGTETDIGTYDNREEDVAFVAERSDHLPFGGEVTVPESALHNIEVCLPEMYQIHLSYLNEEWNDTVVAKWKNTYVTNACTGSDPLWYGKTSYEYIQAHMGYRFVLRDSVFTYTNKYDSLKIALTLENVGFGNLNKTKKARIMFVKNGVISRGEDVEAFDGKSKINYSPSLKSLSKGSYDVYLRLYGEYLSGSPLYALRFANGDLYNSTLSANLIGHITIE